MLLPLLAAARCGLAASCPAPARRLLAVAASSSTSTPAQAPAPVLAARPRRRPVGVALDIDGVLVRGLAPLPGARDALLRLLRASVPFVFLTNGGGTLESLRARALTEQLGVPVHEAQVVLSHTPLRRVVASFADRKVLVLGYRDVLGVARSYGARRAHDVTAVLRDDPRRFPFVKHPHEPMLDAGPFAAVFVLHDPIDWLVEVQVALDVIRGGTPLGAGVPGGPAQQVPVYATNPDLTFAAPYPVPRLACGSFVATLAQVFKAATGEELRVTQIGKPTRRTFRFASARVGTWADYAERTGWAARALEACAAAGVPEIAPAEGEATGWATDDEGDDDDGGDVSSGGGGGGGGTVERRFDRLFMVGDNPPGDIRGANAAGEPWRSILVRTGVFHGAPGSNDVTDPGWRCVGGISDAVDAILDSPSKASGPPS